ncbi:MAG: HDOD domain-containing protein [Woeseiaceae bacterium]|nr:HDOD domain-containing protein [Woeseiaceae bacterium]
MSAVTKSTSTTTNLAKSLSALPPLPATAQEILTCFGDEFIDAHKVTAVVEGDPGICARLLGLANSAYFGLNEPVNRIDEAISRVLGVETVRSLVLAMAIQQSFSKKGCPEFDTERFWTESLLTAECCKRIAMQDKDASIELRDLAYSTGLCHNLGLMALVHLEPQATNTVLMRHRDDEAKGPLKPLFQELLDTDHRHMTAVLARTWSLPEPMVAAYEYRADTTVPCDHSLSLVVAAGAEAVSNCKRNDEHRTNLEPWASELGMTTRDLQSLAVLSNPQQERIESLAQRMTR